MTLGSDQKEDLRLRMMELEKKLTESEEERSKLEKTCNILMRAFREEEKMHYKALNKKYEKFLEDCNLRKRRNDIILKSLCRIEDRARALLAKTERLKILKDRYISCLKINDFKKVESILSLKNFPYVSPSQKITRDVTPKSVHWKSPYISDVMLGHKVKEFFEPQGSSFYKTNSTNDISLENKDKADSLENTFTFSRILECEKLEKDSVKHQNLGEKPFSEDRFNAPHSQDNLGKSFENNKTQKSLLDFECVSLSRENNCDGINYSPIAQSANLKKDLMCPEIAEREIKLVENLNNQPEEESFDAVAARREKVTVTHQESIEKLKKALSVEDDDIENDKKSKTIQETQKVTDKDEIEMNEKTSAQKNNGLNEEPNRLVISKADNDPYNKSKDDAVSVVSDHFDENDEDKVAENLPVGLDGVDYQNETYPESYYEQPVHQNHTSIASDVILEEDEWEQDTDQDGSDKRAKNLLVRSYENENESYFIKNSNQNTSESSEPHLDKQLFIFPDKSDELSEGVEKFISQEKQFKVDDTGFDKEDQSKKSDGVLNSEKNNKRTLQSNLMHLLESDSESFQIEHGDLATGNEDSDFDFSFNQN